mgnify:CR=1 FL=1
MLDKILPMFSFKLLANLVLMFFKEEEGDEEERDEEDQEADFVL